MFVFPFIFAITFKEADASPEAILKQASQEKFRKQSLSCGNFVKKPSRYKFRFRSSVKKKMAYLQRGFVKDWANSV